MKKIFGLAVAAVVILASVAQAEMIACTQRWCQEGLTVNLQGTEWPTGDYIFKVKADEQEFICTSKLPFTDCETSAVTCDKEGVSIGASGCALPPEGHSFHGVMMNNADIKQISVDIMHSNGKKASFTSPVAAQCGYPNGEQCDSHQCCSAVLDAPVVWQ